MSSKDCLKKHSEQKCVTVLKNINDIENKINIELEKAKLLLLLLNCENLDNIKKPLTKIFKKIQSLEREVTIIIDNIDADNYDDIIVSA